MMDVKDLNKSYNDTEKIKVAGEERFFDQQEQFEAMTEGNKIRDDDQSDTNKGDLDIFEDEEI